jgi:hypothetical protein
MLALYIKDTMKKFSKIASRKHDINHIIQNKKIAREILT